MYISESSVEKMLKDAGASRVSKEAKQEFKKYLEKTAFEVAQKAVKLAQHAKRKTVDASDIKLAIP
ncbi:MAG: NFYB/HAP3 family transcription factor subunit [Candidatus Micrarchaeaceae archaeon]|jgi:histone H3/H4|nr:NFYB/HAP3 family transcription factor subunit [Candidatus Marsarchaeota archaeon]